MWIREHGVAVATEGMVISERSFSYMGSSYLSQGYYFTSSGKVPHLTFASNCRSLMLLFARLLKKLEYGVVAKASFCPCTVGHAVLGRPLLLPANLCMFLEQ